MTTTGLTKTQIAEIEETYSIDHDPTIYTANGEPIGMKYTATAHIDDDGAVDDIQRTVGPNWKVEWSGDSDTDGSGNTTGDIDITWEGDVDKSG